MLTKQVFAVAALIASSAAFAADTISVDISRPAGTLSRAEVAAETERALAAGEIRNGPLVELHALVSPAASQSRILAKQTAPTRNDTNTQVASASTNPQK